jgi:hypothetical protein
MERSWTSADRVHAMIGTASSMLADIQRRRERLSDPRSALDRPALAEGYDPLVRRLLDTYAEAAAALCDCASATPATPATPASAARALAAAAAAEYAETIADQLAR